jgi:hypothetical protein
MSCDNCQCGAGEESKKPAVCPPPGTPVSLDEDELCPCGKSLHDCCHKEEILAKQAEES